MTFSTRFSILGYAVERPHLRSSAKSSRFRFFIFTCRRVDNPDLHKYVLWKKSNFLRALQHLDNYQTWESERRAGEGFGPAWILKISAKKVVLLVSSRKKQISPLCPHHLKKFCSNPVVAPPWKKSFRRPCYQTLAAKNRELFRKRIWPQNRFETRSSCVHTEIFSTGTTKRFFTKSELF